jgi:(p)ppGpp synthase/HD superfamily hydrolase
VNEGKTLKNMTAELLEKAIVIAEKMHHGQVDKAGAPYISHPLSVMNQVQTLEEKIVAVLHDAIEDTPLTLADLEREGFPAHILQAIDAISKRKGESEESYLERVMSNRLALRVKIADITDNMRLERIAHPTPKDFARIERYAKMLPILHTAYQKLTS